MEGVATVLPFHRAVIEAPEFRAADGRFDVHTRWIETDFADRLHALEGHARVAPAATANLLRFAIEVDGRRLEIALPAGVLAAAPGSAAALETASATVAEDVVTAPVAGTLLVWQVPDGAEVEAGEVIAVMEAMKMETRIEAPHAGRLKHLAEAGAPLAFGAPLARIESA